MLFAASAVIEPHCHTGVNGVAWRGREHWNPVPSGAVVWVGGWVGGHSDLALIAHLAW